MQTTVNTKNALLWNQIRKEKSLEKAVGMIADVTETAINESVADRCEIRDLVKQSRLESHEEYIELSKLLKGNGNPSKSIIARLERIEENSLKSKANIDKAMWIVVSAFLGNLALAIIKLIAGG